MKTVWSHIGALLLCFSIMLYGVTSDAGTKMGIGTFEMVICSGGGAVSVVIDANGNPINPSLPCCDCLTCVASTVALVTDTFQFCAVPARFSKAVISVADQIPTRPYDTRPQARAPPLATLKNRTSAMLGFGLICEDTTA